jgi:hypothetical protein
MDSEFTVLLSLTVRLTRSLCALRGWSPRFLRVESGALGAGYSRQHAALSGESPSQKGKESCPAGISASDLKPGAWEPSGSRQAHGTGSVVCLWRRAAQDAALVPLGTWLETSYPRVRHVGEVSSAGDFTYMSS